MSFKGIIFDLDGTVVNSYYITLKFLHQVLNKYCDLKLSKEQVNQLFGPSEKMIFMDLIGPTKVENCYEEYFNLFKEHIGEITIFEGFPEILEYLNSIGKKLAIFTGRGRELTFYILEQKKLLNYFEIIVTSEDVNRYKPQPDGVLKVCSSLNIAPSNILHIGDSLLDIASGKNAGVSTGAALWGSRNPKKLEEARPDYLFNHPAEIKRVLHE